jgi:hypothetical protein
VIGEVKSGGRDLVSSANTQAKSLAQVESPENQTRRDKVLLLSIVLTVLK